MIGLKTLRIIKRFSTKGKYPEFHVKGVKLSELKPSNDGFILNPIRKKRNLGDKISEEFYKEKEIPYIPLSEVVNDEKILEIVKLSDKNINELAANKMLNEETLKMAVNDCIPEKIKNKIVIKDFKALEEKLKTCNYSKADIKKILKNTAAMTFSGIDCATLYVKFEMSEISRNKLIKLRVAIAHELTHALKGLLQNTNRTDIYKIQVKCLDQVEIFNKIFHLLEINSHPKKIKQKLTQFREITDGNMLSLFKFTSLQEMDNHCKSIFVNLIKNALIGKELKFENNRMILRQLIALCKHLTENEEIAYSSNILLKELETFRMKLYKSISFLLLGKKSANTALAPRNGEFMPLFYKKMAQVFTNLKINDFWNELLHEQNVSIFLQKFNQEAY